MKKIFLFTLLFYTAFLHGQIIENPDFEKTDTASGTGLAAWRPEGQGFVDRDADTHHSGASAIRISGVDRADYTAFEQELRFPPGGDVRRYRFSGRIKSDGAGLAGLRANVFAGAKILFVDHPYDQLLTGTADWKAVQIEFYTDETVTHANLGGFLSGGGTAWFDDFELRELPLPTGSLPDSLRAYLNEALNLVQREALYRDSVDWPPVRERVARLASGATTYADCYPAIRYALAKMGDNHSFLRTATLAAKWAPGDTVKKFSAATGEMLDGQFAYVNMPAFVWASYDKTANVFAEKMQELLRELDAARPKGWILDLRNNSGGSCFPMLAGIGPLLGEGPCGHFARPDEKPRYWFYRAGKAGVGKQVWNKARRPYRLQQPMSPVAVLTGPHTASAGEVVAVAFRGRANTRSFGAPTAGLSTGNAGFRLRDGAYLFLAVSVYTDRNGVRYGGEIAPDEPVEAGADGAADPVLEAAKRWLGRQ